jgi:hypothetical protein
MTFSERDRATIQAALDNTSFLLGFVMEALPVLRDRMACWERGGFPSSSLPEALAPTNGDVAEPNSDRTDQNMRADVRWLKKQSEAIEFKVRRFALEVQRRTDGYGRTERTVEEESAPCANPPCENEVRIGDRYPDGRLVLYGLPRTCERCRKHKARHGLAWPKKRVAVSS